MTPAKPPRSGPAWKKDQEARRLPVVPIALGLIAVIAIIAIVASSMADDEATSTEGLQQVGPVAVSGDPLPTLEEGIADAAVGVTAPGIEGQSFDGSSVEIDDDGRPKVVVFLAHWCPHCQVEVPKLVDWFAENGVPEDVDVYAVATGTTEDRPNYPPSRWLDREEWDRPTLADSEDGMAANAFGLSAFPFYVALDGDHQVVARGSGELSTEQWESLLDAARG
jgi:thiol-disulfide isomerase/thioredoxin